MIVYMMNRKYVEIEHHVENTSVLDLYIMK